MKLLQVQIQKIIFTAQQAILPEKKCWLKLYRYKHWSGLQIFSQGVQIANLHQPLRTLLIQIRRSLVDAYPEEWGHAWIRLESNSGEVTTMSLWSQRGGGNEFFLNKELYDGYGAVSKSTIVTSLQYNRIIDYNSNPSNLNWTPWNTCAGYSVGLWNYVTGGNLSATDYFRFTTPRSLAGSINKNP